MEAPLLDETNGEGWVAAEASRVATWCVREGVGFEVRPPYPGLTPFAVVEIKDGIKVVHEGRTPMRAYACYKWGRRVG